jgi:hypothetical protein
MRRYREERHPAGNWAAAPEAAVAGALLWAQASKTFLPGAMGYGLPWNFRSSRCESPCPCGRGDFDDIQPTEEA